MAYNTTQVIVLRRVDYRENDRILSLLSPLRGRIDVTARSARKVKSPLLSACELFTMGEYVTYQGKGHETLTAFTLGDSFFPLRDDVTRLSHGAVMLAAAEALAQKEEPAEHLFILLARSLSRLAYGEYDNNAVTAAFLLHISTIEGFKPRLNHCVSCGKTMGEESGFLDVEMGGIRCGLCKGGAPGTMYVTQGQLFWLRDVLVRGIDKTPPIDTPPLDPLLSYVQHHIDRKLPKIIR